MMKVGVLGAGQLGRMLALAGHPLGLDLVFVDPAPGSPAGALASQSVHGYDDPRAVAALSTCDVVTYEFENVPEKAVRQLEQSVRVMPSVEALAVAQDRLREKTTFHELGIPSARFAAAQTVGEFDAAVKQIGFPCVAKTRRLGYDGKGQMVLRSGREAAAAWKALGSTALIVEQLVPFERELSIIAVRGRYGVTRFYPLVQNEHRNGILHISRAPAAVTPQLQATAEDYARRLLERFTYVGVLTLELFQVDGALLANEIAPRVHNSGHWTIEGAVTSQFENHLRAVVGLPLGETTALCPSAMINLIGEIPEASRLLELPDTHLHLYGKAARPGRKLGHVTVRAPDAQRLEASIAAVIAAL
jgi:5-(carboxyamino)imidazole ribonucleotide synthase